MIFHGRKTIFLCFLVGLFFLKTQQVLAADPPILHLKFDDGSGTSPIDSSTNGITTSFTATQPTWSATVPSVSFSNPYSLDFTGSGDGVSVTWPSSLDFTDTEPRTFSFWYRPTANGEGQYSRIISWSNDRLEIAGTEAGATTHKLTYFDGNWHATNITLTLNTWYHITFTYDGTTAKFYIGNSLQDSHALVGRSLSGTLRIGNRVQQNDEGINGQIDDVRIYNYALDATQVSNLAAGSNSPDSAPDQTAPVISSITSSSITSSGATVNWTTDEQASTKVVYSVNTSYASTTAESDTGTRVTNHSQALTNLLSCTTYNFKTVSRDTASNSATSTGQSFTTTGCSGGATPSSATSTTVTVSSAATSTVTDSGRTITVETPANFTATSSSVVIQIKGLNASTVLNSIGKPSSSLSSAANIVFNVTALIDNITELDSFSTPVTVSYTYTDSDVNGINESSLSMYHYDNGTWSQLNNCSVNTTANKITCSAPHFSIFAIFGNATSQSTSSASKTSGASIKSRVANLRTIGDHAQADNLVRQLPHLFESTETRKNLFSRNLSMGMIGEDVKNLQKYLNQNGFTIASEGPGSPGNETLLFGNLTKKSTNKIPNS